MHTGFWSYFLSTSCLGLKVSCPLYRYSTLVYCNVLNSTVIYQTCIHVQLLYSPFRSLLPQSWEIVGSRYGKLPCPQTLPNSSPGIVSLASVFQMVRGRGLDP
ncbi:hypothetical protein BJV74DRAFT_74149 [Russula compacta]|nr:hypothetical protein BJV74DRAFT_74149 [Russula compacta]